MQEAINLLIKATGFMASAEGAALAWLLFTLSEALAAIPSVQANSVYQAIRRLIGWVYERVRGKVPWRR
jgi:hypothetical protein